MAELALVLAAGVCMVMEVAVMAMAVTINLASSTMVEDLGVMVGAMDMVRLLDMVRRALLHILVVQCTEEVDMLLGMGMVGMGAAMVVMVVVGGMEDTIHMEGRANALKM